MFIFDLQVPTCYTNFRPYRNVFILKTFQEYWEKFCSHNTYKKMNRSIYKKYIYLSTNLNHASIHSCMIWNNYSWTSISEISISLICWICQWVNWKSWFTNFNLFISNPQIRSFLLVPCIKFQQIRFYLYIQETLHDHPTVMFYCQSLTCIIIQLKKPFTELSYFTDGFQSGRLVALDNPLSEVIVDLAAVTSFTQTLGGALPNVLVPIIPHQIHQLVCNILWIRKSIC